MSILRWIVLLVATATPAVAFRLGGPSLYTAYAAGLTVAAAIAAYALWQDDLLKRVILPKGLDISAGALGAALLFVLVVLVYAKLVAPVDPFGGLLRKCNADGARFPRPDAHGLLALAEWTRNHVCRAYAQALGMGRPVRGAMIVLIATLEEIAWRGGVQQGLSERLGSTRGWLAASVLYGLANLLTGNPPVALLALAGGLVWGGLYRYRGRLAPGIFSHAVFSYFLFDQRPLVDLG
jgi:hypothetical protein